MCRCVLIRSRSDCPAVRLLGLHCTLELLRIVGSIESCSYPTSSALVELQVFSFCRLELEENIPFLSVPHALVWLRMSGCTANEASTNHQTVCMLDASSVDREWDMFGDIESPNGVFSSSLHQESVSVYTGKRLP